MDYLKNRNPPEVAAFFRRLALVVQKAAGERSLAAEMLLHWLDGKARKKIFSSDYLKDVPAVDRYLLKEVRPVFLTEKKAVLIGHRIWGGIVARLMGIIPTDAMPQRGDGSWPISYEGSSLKIPKTSFAKLRFGIKSDERKQDLFYALHDFGLATDVTMTVISIGSQKYEARFTSWRTKAIDRYHWDPNKSIVVPNPDFRSTARNAVAPKKPSIVIYYRHAVRVEQAGLAHSFDSESTEWTPNDSRITAPAVVDTSLFRIINGKLARSRRLWIW
jgi:hypothetical protein